MDFVFVYEVSFILIFEDNVLKIMLLLVVDVLFFGIFLYFVKWVLLNRFIEDIGF